MERCEKGSLGVSLVAFGYAYWKFSNGIFYGIKDQEEEEEINDACMISITASCTAVATIGVGQIVRALTKN